VSTEETVRALVDAAALRPDAEEMAELVRVYPVFRAGLDALYAVPEARYESPSLVFGAAGPLVEWTDA
jgi:hypothetical protein